MDKATNTSEFWVTAFVNVVAAIVAILSARGIVSSDEAGLWVQLAQTIGVIVAPLVMGWVSKSFIQSRTELRVAAIHAGIIRQ